MNHPDWPLFLTAIVANPDDDTLRLVVADFLEEHGELDRAAFIRVQIALANLDASIRQEKLEGDELRWQALSLEADDLRRQEGTFLSPKSAFPRLWAEDACPGLVCQVPTRRGLGLSYQDRPAEFVWYRGFVERIDCEAKEWLRHGVEVRMRNPVREVILRACTLPPRSEWAEHLDTLHGLRKVWLDTYLIQRSHQEFMRWLELCLPGTEVVGSSF